MIIAERRAGVWAPTYGHYPPQLRNVRNTLASACADEMDICTHPPRTCFVPAPSKYLPQLDNSCRGWL